MKLHKLLMNIDAYILKYNPEENLSIKYNKFLLWNFLISYPLVAISYASRKFNIFDTTYDSYIEHFIYGFVGSSFLITTFLIILYKIKSRPLSINIMYFIGAIVVILLSFWTEFNRDAVNVVNHFYFDSICAAVSFTITYKIFKNCYVFK